MTLAAPGDALQQSESRHNDAMSGGPPRFFSFVQLPSGTVVVGSCTRGMSRSVDGGKTWTPIDALSEVSENGFAVAPDSAVLVATSGGLARSTDDAVSWEFLDDEPVYATLPDGADRPDIGTVYRLHELPDGRRLAGTDGHGVWIRDGGQWMPSGLDGMIVYSLAVTAVRRAARRHAGRLRLEIGGRWRDVARRVEGPSGQLRPLPPRARRRKRLGGDRRGGGALRR